MADTTHVVAATSKTVLNMINNIYARTPLTFVPNMQTTLNTKYGFNQAVQPTSVPKILYFGIGIGGKYNVTDTNLSAAYKPSMAEMDLYSQLPFRCLPEDEDDNLSASERAKYRLRIPRVINGVKYYLYYLKMLEYTDNVYLRYIDPSTGQELAYELDTSNLNPVGKIPSTSGLVDTTITDITVYCVANAVITGSEVVEAVNVLYGGDLRYAVISELGVYSGQEQTVTTVNSQSVSFSYTDAIYVQLATKNTWNGFDMHDTAVTDTRKVIISEGSVMILADGVVS